MLSLSKNPWIKKVEDKEAIEAQEKLAIAMARKAQEILKDEKFVQYKKMYQEYHDREMENIMFLNESDPIKYAFKVRQVIDTLKAYRLLISSIEEDASIQITEDVK